MWDWVELYVELEDGHTTVESLHCNEVATDTDYCCSMQELSWGWEVREFEGTNAPIRAAIIHRGVSRQAVCAVFAKLTPSSGLHSIPVSSKRRFVKR
jgi:hypothetical protein